MARIRLRIRLNEGGEGVPLDQLADVGREVERFLRSLAQDVGVVVPKGQWLAREFRNESVSFDSEGPAEYPLEQIREFNAAFNSVAGFDPLHDRLNGSVRHKTLLQFARIADSLQSHERISFGIYRPDQDMISDWKPLTKRRASRLKEQLVQTVYYTGTIRARLHNVIVEPAFSFNVREERSNALIRCDADDELYDELHRAMRVRNALLYVRGRIGIRRVDQLITSIRVLAIKMAPNLSRKEYESFFGIAPNYTGELTTEQFIERARSRDH